MKAAHDIYAETNPAFCAAAIIEFTKSYLSTKHEGPDVLIAYLAIPLALSGDFASTFNGTNKNTGLLEWLERSPRVQVGLAERINASLDIVTEALRFGCFTGVLAITAKGQIGLGSKKLKASAINALGDESANAIKRAARLGHWFASAGSTRSMFNVVGVTV